MPSTQSITSYSVFIFFGFVWFFSFSSYFKSVDLCEWRVFSFFSFFFFFFFSLPLSLIFLYLEIDTRIFASLFVYSLIALAQHISVKDIPRYMRDGYLCLMAGHDSQPKDDCRFCMCCFVFILYHVFVYFAICTCFDLLCFYSTMMYFVCRASQRKDDCRFVFILYLC